jgi:hypothetical protein
MQADTTAFEGLAARVATLEQQVRDVTRLHEIIIAAGEPDRGQPALSPARRRDRHGLYAIRGGDSR